MGGGVGAKALHAARPFTSVWAAAGLGCVFPRLGVRLRIWVQVSLGYRNEQVSLGYRNELMLGMDREMERCVSMSSMVKARGSRWRGALNGALRTMAHN